MQPVATSAPVPVNWWLEGGKMVVTMATVVLGSWLGAVIALSRFKSERAFERRLDWYERSCRALYRVGWKIAAASHLLKRGNREEAKALVLEAAPMIDELSAVLAEHELYAKHNGADAIRKSIVQINRLGQIQHEANQAGIDAVQAVTHELSQTLGRTATILAEEVREDFDWKKLPRHPGLGWPLGIGRKRPKRRWLAWLGREDAA